MGWLPIESAPKDGTAVLITNVGPGMHIKVGCYIPIGWRQHDEPKDDAWWAVHRGEELVGMRPTHWMPLPDPPNNNPEDLAECGAPGSNTGV